jgi:hypothetical protein
MSQRSIGVVRLVYRAAADGDSSGTQWLDERFPSHLRSSPDAVIGESVDLPRWKPERFIDLQEQVLVRVKFSGRGSKTGHDIETRIAHLWTFEPGEPARLCVYHDWESALSTVGLAE